MDTPTVGIDLGTTYSAIAYVDEQGRPRAIPNPEGKNATPSVVLIDGGRIAVGEVALNEWVTNEAHVVRWIKRAMGDSDYRFQSLTPVQISAEILKGLRRDAEIFFGQPLGEAVITCPAYFASIEIENTKAAGELAGLRVREVVKEPTAAAVYYGVDNMRDGERVLVCDLGGGTFDATVLTLREGTFLPLASMGDRQLGGHDWTMELLAMVAEAVQERFGGDPRNDLVAGQRLYEACEQAKRDFARLSQVAVPCQFQGRMEQLPVSRDAFESRTEWRVQQLVMWCERALAKAQPALSWGEVDRILLVGGSSRLRRMSLALQAASGKVPVQTGEPDLMVALGAAVLARGKVRPRKSATAMVESQRTSLVEVNYARVTARALGTRAIVLDAGEPRVANSLIIPHNTVSPVSRSRDDFEVSSNRQLFFDVPVVEFESSDDFDVVASYRFQCLPDAKRGDVVRVTFEYDISGIVSVSALDLKSGAPLQSQRLPYEDPDISKVGRMSLRPRWVVFAVDTSYSMKGAKIDAAIHAVIDNARKLIELAGNTCKVGIVSFDSDAKILCAPTSDFEAISRAAAKLVPAGSTAMDAGIVMAANLVMSSPEESDRDVVMLTDGMPDDARRANTMAVARECRSKGITLSSLGVGKEQVDLDFLNKLTPISLVLDGTEGISAAMTTLLTQSAAARSGRA